MGSVSSDVGVARALPMTSTPWPGLDLIHSPSRSVSLAISAGGRLAPRGRFTAATFLAGAAAAFLAGAAAGAAFLAGAAAGAAFLAGAAGAAFLAGAALAT